jgi:hypothetical protein
LSSCHCVNLAIGPPALLPLIITSLLPTLGHNGIPTGCFHSLPLGAALPLYKPCLPPASLRPLAPTRFPIVTEQRGDYRAFLAAQTSLTVLCDMQQHAESCLAEVLKALYRRKARLNRTLNTLERKLGLVESTRSPLVAVHQECWRQRLRMAKAVRPR